MNLQDAASLTIPEGDVRNTTADGVSTFSWGFDNVPDYARDGINPGVGACTYLVNRGFVSNANLMYYNFIAYALYYRSASPASKSFYANTKDANLTAFKAGITGEKLYYPLATPTDTKITDATLISQLNAVHDWLIRHDYSGTVSGNLPIIINRTGLT